MDFSDNLFKVLKRTMAELESLVEQHQNDFGADEEVAAVLGGGCLGNVVFSMIFYCSFPLTGLPISEVWLSKHQCYLFTCTWRAIVFESVN